MSNYISFHNHDSLGSLLDSSLKIKDLVAWAKANKMSHVGTLNHGNLTSCIALWKECNKQEIIPILGFEGYVTENKLDESGKKIRDNHHIGLIAKNQTGWFNLIKLHNLSWKEDRYYYDPRITIQDLLDHKEGLIVTSACIGGILGRPFCNNELDKAESVLKILLDNFGDDFYLEMQEHASFNEEDRKKQTNYNKWLIKMSKKYNIKLIIQNDSHYYLKEHWLAHQVLLCKNTGSKLKKPVFAFDSHEYYLKNEAEMVEAFQEYPLQLVEECFKNTKEIAEKCEKFDITNKKYDCPSFGEPEETFKQLSELAQNGLNKKFTASFLKEHPEYQERLDYELSVIKNVGYTDYFLMLDDLYKFTSKKGIYMGIGRGSAGGSLVLYCLGIIFIDPIKYNLLFERFINPSRVSMADVDCDVEDCRRQEVIDYLKKRYGEDHVCNIGTYGEMTAKASFKAVASILEIPFEKANKLSAIMMSDLSLEENFKQVDTFRCAIQNDDKLKQAFEIAKILEGTYAQRGLHACGMVISSKPLDEVCACVTVKDTKSGERIVATSNEMKEIDGDIKLLKLDILGLRNLTILDNADKLIRKTHGTTIDYKNLDVEDNETFELLSNGYTQCVFQFESKLMQSIIKRVQPKSIDDLSCITALARPGCLDSGLTEQFIKRRNGEEDVIPLVNGIEEYMKDTLQLPVYQENCMQLSRVMAGFNGAEADTLRKCIGKKDPEKLKHEREHFVNGAVSLGHSVERANEIFDIIEKFGGYGFNKSHAVGYSLLSYATAYYKTHYPTEYMCAVLNSVTDDLDKLNLYINECYRLGIKVCPPDVNDSEKDFIVNESGELVFGLSAIKGLGKAVVNDIIRARSNKKFVSIEDFIERVNKADKGSIQALLRVGAFNKLVKYPKRWDLLCDYINDAKNSKYYIDTENLEQAVYHVVGTKAGKKSDKYIEIQEEKRGLKSSRQDKLYREELNKKQDDLLEYYIDVVKRQFLKATTYKPAEKIQNEQELMGFNISTNPYKRWDLFKKYYTRALEGGIPYVELNDLVDDFEKFTDLKSFYTVGLLTDIKELKTKKGQKMAKLTFEYFGSKTTVTVFPSDWENDLEFKVQKGNMVSITGHLVETNKQYSDDDYEIRFTSMRQLNVLINENNKCIIDIKNKNIEDVNFAVKKLAYSEKSDNLPVERVVVYKKDDKMLVLQGILWINNPDKLLNYLR